MLDEIKSLLQKSLRRKDQPFVAASASELLRYGKDQLPWKCLLTYLMEDHCLNSGNAFSSFYEFYKQNDKLSAVELLLNCYTCRVAACLPVISLQVEYKPCFFTESTASDEMITGLVTAENNRLDFDKIFKHLRVAWKNSDVRRMITVTNLCMLGHDVESRQLTEKGFMLMQKLGTVKKPNLGHLVMYLLNFYSVKDEWKSYTEVCFKLLSIPKCCVRLVLFSVTARLQFEDNIKPIHNESFQEIAWNEVSKLTVIPTWAIDKHTYRGRFGTASSQLLGDRDFSLLHRAQFHGVVEKKDIKCFLEEGCRCSKEILPCNPYWQKTKELYLSRPRKLQKTAKMVAVYYKELQICEGCKIVFTQKVKHINVNFGSRDTSILRYVSLKRKSTENHVAPVKNVRFANPLEEIIGIASDNPLPSNNLCDNPSKKPCLEKEDTLFGQRVTDLPLLQLPTNCNKTYTRILTDCLQVCKGPYRRDKLMLATFFHSAMKKVFQDRHTLDFQIEGAYIVYPLLTSNDIEQVKITCKDYFDQIAGLPVVAGKLVDRSSLGVVQLHKLSADETSQLPVTVWYHFIFRYLLNVGDSGLYNAISNKELSRVYGIDMEENRGRIKRSHLLNLMFSKLPNKKICTIIVSTLLHNADELQVILDAIFNNAMESLQDLADEHNVTENVVQRCKDRIHKVKQSLLFI